MTVALVTTTELFTWLGVDEGSVSTADTNRAQGYIDAASARVRSEARQTWLNEAGDALEGVPDEIPGIVLQVAERKWRNPSGVVHETAGPFSARHSEDIASGIYLTEDEAERLKAYRPSQTGGLYTIRTTRGDLETRDGDIDVVGQPDYPMGAGYLT